MRGSRTLVSSLAREIVEYTLIGFAATSVVLVSQNLLRRLEELTSVGFTLADLGGVLRCLFPMLTVYTIPLALLFGTVLALRRRVADSEVLAMRACGVGIGTLLAPALAIGVLTSALSAWLLVAVEHEARRELQVLLNAVAARGGVLQAGTFRGLDDRVIYVAERHRDNRLENVMISDRSHDPPLLIFAEGGRLSLDEDSARIHLELGPGEMHIAPGRLEPDRYRRVLFRTFDYWLDASALLSGEAWPVRPKQMSLAELQGVIERARSGDPLDDLKERDPIVYELEIERRRALPLAPALFSLAAVPLALRGPRSSRSFGPVACAALAFAYYAISMLLQFLAREAWLSPSLAFWLPNALLALVSLQQLERLRTGAPE